MNRLNKSFGIIVFITIISFSITSCEINSITKNPFEGIWVGYDYDYDVVKVIVGSSTWTMSWPSYPRWGTVYGTYTYNGNTATFMQNGIAVGTATVSGNTLTVIVTAMGPMILTRQ